ncbi:hypothetical protein SB761_33600, partial [Pseudomonas sp. SIMBA_064]
RVLDHTNYALEAGSIMAELNCESYKEAITKVKNKQAIGFMPFDTSDGLTGIERNAHYVYADYFEDVVAEIGQQDAKMAGNWV